MSAPGVLLPYRGCSPREAVRLGCLAEDLGFDSVWASEAAGADAFAQLAAIAERTSTIALGTAIVPLGTRSPALIAMSADTISGLSQGRFSLGIGVSSKQILEQWHGLEQRPPLASVRDAVAILKQALDGETTDRAGEAFHSNSFRLTDRAGPRPPLLLAALGPRMRKLAGELADGMILNFVPRSAAAHLSVASASRRASFRTRALVRVAVEPTGTDVEQSLRRELASYIRVEPYARWLVSLGLGDVVERVRSVSGLQAKAEALPWEVVRDISIVGGAEECREQLAGLIEVGVDPIVVPTATSRDGGGISQVLRALASTTG